MIKINLIAEAKSTRSSGPKFNFDAPANMTNFLMAGVLTVSLLAAGGWWWIANGNVKEWEQKNRDADAEIQRLQPILKEAERYERRKELLQNKIDLVTNLKRQQSVPVHIMDQISRNLPEFLWLSSMTSTNNKINVKGSATTYNAVSNFYNNLATSGYFADVTLGKTSETKQGVSFSLTCIFAPEADAPPQETIES